MTTTRYYRKVIRIRGEDSPNVRRELGRLRGEPEESLPPETPGVLSYPEYRQRRATWDKVRQCVGLDAEFYEGPAALLFPPEWLNLSERLADALRGRRRQAKGIGIDPGEGEADTSMAAVDEFGLVELESKPTPDTDVIPREALAFMRRHNVPPERTVFDRGGGGKQAADRLRAQGYAVQTVAFGESVVPAPRRRPARLSERVEEKEERYVYVNRRAEMYGELSEAMDPGGWGEADRDAIWLAIAGLAGDPQPNVRGFAIPAEYTELRRQLAPIPKLYDAEGRLWLPPKSKKDPNSKVKTLVEILGCSPDQADAVVMARWITVSRARRAAPAGVF